MPQMIKCEALWKLMRCGANFDLVDTLPRAAYERHQLPAAIHIASNGMETEGPRRLPERGDTVVMYCGSAACKRQANPAARQVALGNRGVCECVEGRQHWDASGLPVESGRDSEEHA